MPLKCDCRQHNIPTDVEKRHFISQARVKNSLKLYYCACIALYQSPATSESLVFYLEPNAAIHHARYVCTQEECDFNYRSSSVILEKMHGVAKNSQQLVENGFFVGRHKYRIKIGWYIFRYFKITGRHVISLSLYTNLLSNLCY